MPFPFLHLPPELRNTIYTLALTSPTPLILAPYKPHVHRPATPLLRTCRQIHHEATPLLYTSNTFNFLSRRAYHTLLYFLTQIGARNTRWLRNVGVVWPAGVGIEVLGQGREWVTRVVGVVERAMKGLEAAAAAAEEEGEGAALVLHVYHAWCLRDVVTGESGVLMCRQAHFAAMRFLDWVKVRKVFHASPLEIWAGGNEHYLWILGEMRKRGWDIRLYENDCLDPSAEPRDFDESCRTTT
jgi:hypothetical protein